MKYSLITSALVLASTVVAQIPPSYQTNNNNNNGNVEASPVGGNVPAHKGGNADVNPVANSRPVQRPPTGYSHQQGSKEDQNGDVESSPVSGRPMNNRPVPQGFGPRPVPSRQQQGDIQNHPLDTVASPVGGFANGGPMGLMSTCLSQPEAYQFVQRFATVLSQSGSDLGDTNVTARALVSEDFVEHSNSILSVQGLPTGDGIAAKDKETWVQGITHAPASRGIVTLDIAVACDVIYWHWVFNKIGSGQYPVKGFNRFEMVRSGRDAEVLQARRLDLEFDSIAWGLNGQIQSCTFPDGRTIGANAQGSASNAEES